MRYFYLLLALLLLIGCKKETPIPKHTVQCFTSGSFIIVCAINGIAIEKGVLVTAKKGDIVNIYLSCCKGQYECSGAIYVDSKLVAEQRSKYLELNYMIP